MAIAETEAEIEAAAKRIAAKQADLKKQEDLRRMRLLEQSKIETETLASFIVLSEKNTSKYKEHSLTVTNAGIRGLAWVNGWVTSTNTKEDLYWFCYFSNKPIEAKESWKDGAPIAIVNFVQPGNWNWAAIFSEVKDRDLFVETTSKAIKAWYNTYSEILDDPGCPKPQRVKRKL